MMTVVVLSETGEALVPADAGIWDNYCVKKQIINSRYVLFSRVQ